MGCCSSTNNVPSSPPPKTRHFSDSRSSTKECGDRKSPPPLQQEEESVVKEVLSETATTIPKTRFAETASLLTDDDDDHLHKSADGKKRNHQNRASFNKPFVSTANESAATVSTAIAENNGDGLSETRRRSEEPTGQDRPGYDWRTDSGESSGRRSRFPVMYSDSWSWERGIDGSQSSRKTGGSPERVGSGLGERIRKVDEQKDTWPPTSNELLENPLMSLECFIFL